MIYFAPILSVWVIILILAVSAFLIAFSYYAGTSHVLSENRRKFLIALRAVAFLILALMISSPVLNKLEVNKRKSNIVFLVDSSSSMGVADEAGGGTRYQAATEFMKGRKFKKLSGYPVSYYAFNDKAEKKTAMPDLEKVRVSGGTDFAAAVRQVDKDIGLSDTAALVFVTDGLDYSGFRGNDIQVPVYCVRTGTDLAECKDAGIDSFKCPEKVRVGEEIELKVPLSVRGYDKVGAIDFSIFEDGVPKEQKKLKVDRGPAVEKVKHVFQKEGLHILKIQIGRLPGEATYLNNEREMVFEVLKDDSKLVVYFPELSNSYRPMIRLLEQDMEKFTAFYKAADGKFVLRGIEPDQQFSTGMPSSPDKLSKVSVFVLGSHNRPALTDAEEDVLEKYVSGGGSLILLGGNDSFGMLPEASPLRRLSPFVHADSSFAAGTYKVAVNTEDSSPFAERVQEVIRRNGEDPDFVLRSVNAVKQVKSNSKVLLWADSQSSRQPLVVVQPFGKGMVIGVLSNSIHLWGNMAARTENFNDFWRQLLNYAKAGAESDILKIAVNKSELISGETLDVSAVVSVPDGKDTARALKLSAELSDLSTGIIVSSAPMEGKGDLFKCSFPSLKPGRYLLKVICADKDRTLRQRYKLILCGETIRENMDVKSVPDKFLDYSSPKHVYKTSQRDDLENDICDGISKNKVEKEEKLVFKTPWFFAILLALLLAEWTLRRKFNAA